MTSTTFDSLPIRRRPAVRVVFVDREGRCLLARHAMTSGETDTDVLWLAPGGAVERGESLRQAAAREVYEETGKRDVEVGELATVRRKTFRWKDAMVDAVAYYFVVRTQTFDPEPAKFSETERETWEEWSWRTPEEFDDADEVIVPPELGALVAGEVPGRIGDWGDRTLFATVGHSNRSIGEFVSVLRAAGIDLVVDVRSARYSKRPPWLRPDSLHSSLTRVNIGYAHLPELGAEGAMPGTAERPEPSGITRLEELAAAHDLPGLLFAEREPSHCHSNLVADALLTHGHAVLHVVDERDWRPHFLPAADATAEPLRDPAGY